MDLLYVAENVLLATRKYKNWPAAIKAIAPRSEFEIVTLRNGLQMSWGYRSGSSLNVYLCRYMDRATAAAPKPILTVRGTPLAVASLVAYLMDADTGNALVNIRGQERHPMASTTKIMTALIAIEKGELDQIVTIKQEAVDEVKKYHGSSAQLVVGDQIRLKDLLYCFDVAIRERCGNHCSRNCRRQYIELCKYDE